MKTSDGDGTVSLELLLYADDLSGLILSHLSLTDISSASLVSKRCRRATRSDALWQRLYHRRWKAVTKTNCWKAYKRAHQNPHDFWLSHVNIVWPWEGLAAGRCCIPSGENPNHDDDNNDIDSENEAPYYHFEAIRTPRAGKRLRESKSTTACPTCRLNNNQANNDNERVLLQNAPETRAQALAEATRLLQRKLQVFQPDYAAPSSFDSQRAFAQAVTCNRRLNLQQYSENDADCLTDLLFFPVVEDDDEDAAVVSGNEDDTTDPTTTAAAARQQAQAGPADTSHVQMNHNSIPTKHSWHVVQCFNASSDHPIVFDVSIQRPDCFAVYPSQGYLDPGQSMAILFSVQSKAMQLLQEHRQTTSSKRTYPLPKTPYMIRYRCTVRVPVFNSCYMVDPFRQVAQPVALSNPLSQKKHTLDYHWMQSSTQEQLPPAHAIRTIALAAHVHQLEDYHLYDFMEHACQPHHMCDNDNKNIPNDLQFVAPCMQEAFPEEYTRLFHQSCEDACYRTEGPCCQQSCECTSWGDKQEEWYHAFIVMKGECAAHRQQQRDLCERKTAHVETIVRVITAQLVARSKDALSSTEWMTRVTKLLLTAEENLKSLPKSKGAVIDSNEKKRLDRLHCELEELRRQVGATSGHSSQSIHCQQRSRKASTRNLASESTALENCHQLSSRVAEPVLLTDIYDNNVLAALKAGACLVSNPQALVGHGMYDRIPYPGIVARRPKMMLRVFMQSMDDLETRLSVHRFTGLLGTGYSEDRLCYYRLLNALDVNSIIDVHDKYSGMETKHKHVDMFYSMSCFLLDIPPPGTGRFPLSCSDESSQVIVKLDLSLDGGQNNVAGAAAETRQSTETETAQAEPAVQIRANELPRQPARLPRRRFFQLLWILAAQMGFVLHDPATSSSCSVLVDRRILIATHWICIVLMTGPLSTSLFLRSCKWIPTQPLQQELNDLFFIESTRDDLRYLTAYECGVGVLVVGILTMILIRWVERNVHRDYVRILQDHRTPLAFFGPASRWRWRRWLLGGWFFVIDRCLPRALQERLNCQLPWATRCESQVHQHASFWSSHVGEMIIRSAAANQSQSMYGDIRDKTLRLGNQKDWSLSGLLFVFLSVSMASFCSSAPQFYVNLLCIYSCSLGLGMSVSLQDLEREWKHGGIIPGGAATSPTTTYWYNTKHSFFTVIIAGCLLGQLIGSSGGTLFLAEFVVTSISLVLGGAGTVSAHAIASWTCLFHLAHAAFWAYVFGRVALLDNVKKKRVGLAAKLLWYSFIAVVVGWMLVLVVWSGDDGLANVLIERGAAENLKRGGSVDLKKLQ